jgi:hypothetical protein
MGNDCLRRFVPQTTSNTTRKRQTLSSVARAESRREASPEEEIERTIDDLEHRISELTARAREALRDKRRTIAKAHVAEVRVLRGNVAAWGKMLENAVQLRLAAERAEFSATLSPALQALGKKVQKGNEKLQKQNWDAVAADMSLALDETDDLQSAISAPLARDTDVTDDELLRMLDEETELATATVPVSTADEEADALPAASTRSTPEKQRLLAHAGAPPLQPPHIVSL